MADKIEYLIISGPNYLQAVNGNCWSAHEELGDDPDCMSGIRIDHAYETENVASLCDWDAENIWRFLSGGLDAPEKVSIQTAVAFAEAIWLDTVYENVDKQFLADSEYCFDYRFTSALKLRVDEDIWEYLDPNNLEDAAAMRDWDVFYKAGIDAGVLHKVKAWAAGVPLADVLAG